MLLYNALCTGRNGWREKSGYDEEISLPLGNGLTLILRWIIVVDGIKIMRLGFVCFDKESWDVISELFLLELILYSDIRSPRIPWNNLMK